MTVALYIYIYIATFWQDKQDKFNILIAFLSDKKKVETLIEENSQTFIYHSNSNMLFGPKFKITESKSKEFFGVLSYQQQQSIHL